MAGVRSHFVVVATGRSNSGRAEQQLGGEELLADSALGFQLAAMTLAVRTRHRAAEQAGVLRRYPEVELKPAAGILTNGAINDSRRAGAFGFMSADCCLHFLYPPLPRYRVRGSHPIKLI